MKETLVVLTVSLCACATPTAHRAPVNGLSMYYEETGSGAPVVLLHGGGSTAQTSWGRLMPELAKNHRVIAPEQQAHGHTADIDRPLSYAQQADDTAALLEQLGVREVHVMGFSNGGIIAMQLAMRHPGLVRRLIVFSSPYARSGFPPGFFDAMKHASLDTMPKDLRAAMVAAAPSPDQVQRMFDKQVALMHGFVDLPEDALRAIGKPALVMAGDSDIVTPEHAASLARLLGAKLAILPGSGHGTYLGTVDAAKADTLPPVTLRLVEAFLADRL